MSRKQDRMPKNNLIKILIAVVAVLLAVNVSLLVFIGLLGRDSTSTSRDNVISVVDEAAYRGAPMTQLRAMPSFAVPRTVLASTSTTTSDKLTLSFWTGYNGSKSFKLENMMPGDTQTREYTVTIKTKNAQKVYFEIKNLKETKVIANDNPARLADTLLITVTANGTRLYSGVLGKMPQLSFNVTKNVATQTVNFKITITLPTSAGNEVAGKRVAADFYWTLEESTPVETDPPKPPIVTDPVKPPVETDPPKPPIVTDPVETKPVETDPPETDPPETDPPETDPPETDPPETDPIETDPPETDPIETDPIETDPPETDPPETDPPETDPPETDPPETDPPETDPTEPPVVHGHEGCCRCFFCHWLCGLFGIHNRACITCRFISWIIGADEIVHLCPWGCIILTLLIIAIVVYIILRRKKKQKEEEAAANGGSGTAGGENGATGGESGNE